MKLRWTQEETHKANNNNGKSIILHMTKLAQQILMLWTASIVEPIDVETSMVEPVTTFIIQAIE